MRKAKLITSILSVGLLTLNTFDANAQRRPGGGQSQQPAKKEMTAPAPAAQKPATPAVAPKPVSTPQPAKLSTAPAHKKPKLPIVNMDVLPISYNVQDRGDAGLKRLDLFFTLDGGNTWTFYGSDADLKPPIEFRVKQDGEYGFYTVATDLAGNSEASPTKGARAHVSVIVDRKLPTVRVLSPRNGDVFSSADARMIRWVAADENLIAMPISLQYSVDGGKNWRPIADSLANTGNYKWAPPQQSVLDCRVRVVATDYAGNNTVESSGNFLIDSEAPISKITGPNAVGAKMFDITYEVSDRGGAGVAQLELWIKTADKPWAKHSTHNDAKRPIKFVSQTEGYIELGLVAIDRVGNREANPGQKKASKAFMVGIDVSPPTVELTSFDKGGIFKGGTQKKLSWVAKDSNLSPRPITVQFSSNNGKTWNDVAKALPNTGSLSWVIPDVDTKLAKVKVIAKDNMGHMAEVQSNVSFVIDSKAPESRAFFNPNGTASIPSTTRNVGVSKPKTVRAPVATKLGSTDSNDNGYGEIQGLIDTGNYQAAETLVLTKLRGNPDDAKAYLLKGKIALAKNNLIAARDDFLRVLVLDRNSVEGHLSLAKTYYKGKDFIKCIPEFEAVLKQDPKNDEAHSHLGVIYYKLGIDEKNKNQKAYIEKAKSHLKSSLGAGTAKPIIYWYLARISEYQKEWNKAVGYWEEAARLYGETELGKRAQQNLVKAMKKLN